MVCLLLNSRGVDSSDFESKSSSATTDAATVMAAESPPGGVMPLAGCGLSSITSTGRLHHSHGGLSGIVRAVLPVTMKQTLIAPEKKSRMVGATSRPYRAAGAADAIRRTPHHASSALSRVLLWMSSGLTAVMP